MILQLLSTMLLLAGSAIGAGAGNYNDHLSQNNSTHINAPASPKRANYDPTGTYGTTAGQLYNYTSYDLVLGQYMGSWSPGFTCEQNSNCYALINSQSKLALKETESGQVYQLIDFGVTETTYTFDLYANGAFVQTLTTAERYGMMLLSLNQIEINAENGGYYWLFDHNEPLSPEAIFDVVGDATTASAGIIGNGFNAMIALFYANNQLTGLGIISLILTGVGLVWFAWRLVLALFRRRA